MIIFEQNYFGRFRLDILIGQISLAKQGLKMLYVIGKKVPFLHTHKLKAMIIDIITELFRTTQTH